MHVRAAVIRTQGDRRAVVCFVFHHICIDGVSEGLFVREVWRCYRACLDDAAFVAARPSLQYKDYAQWQRAGFAGEYATKLDADRDFWRRELDGYQPIELMCRSRSGQALPLEHGFAVREIDGPTTEGVVEFSGSLDASPFIVILTALQLVIARQADVDDVVVGIPFAGRERSELDGMLGYFINMLSVS